jgi:hypothetical protein
MLIRRALEPFGRALNQLSYGKGMTGTGAVANLRQTTEWWVDQLSLAIVLAFVTLVGVLISGVALYEHRQRRRVEALGRRRKDRIHLVNGQPPRNG